MSTVDNFNSYTDGDLNGQGGWSGNVKYDVEGTVVQEGAKAVECVDNDATGQVISKSITAVTTSGIWSSYIRSSSATGATRGVFFYNGANLFGYIRFHPGGNIQYSNNTNTFDIQAYAANTWYFCEFDIDLSAHTVRARIDGGTWQTTQSTITDTQVDTVKISGGSENNSVTTYVDLIVSPAAAAGTAKPSKSNLPLLGVS